MKKSRVQDSPDQSESRTKAQERYRANCHCIYLLCWVTNNLEDLIENCLETGTDKAAHPRRPVKSRQAATIRTVTRGLQEVEALLTRLHDILKAANVTLFMAIVTDQLLFDFILWI